MHHKEEEGVKELKRSGKEWKNAGRRSSVQDSLNAVNSLKRVETRKLEQYSIPSQIISLRDSHREERVLNSQSQL